MKLVQKLSSKAMGWNRNAIGTAVTKVPPANGRVLLGRIACLVSGIKTSVNPQTGEIMTGLKGNFRGVPTKPGTDEKTVYTLGGEEVTSGVCYLPSGIQSMIEGALADAQEKDKSATVRVVLDLYAIPASNAAGYSFDADTIEEPTTDDPLSALLKEAEGNKALPAPPKAHVEKVTKEKAEA